ncbi:hypothetical protein [Streptomyces sp. NBC_01549]|uniref:hypothetical protein n=1 Tax=Streptomyces sp. NBC_01549 TaxID=2975874 RepID=UPI002253D77B|nr:hypothetical protein [Streptomyces sp. NBC_01549]
MLSNAPDLHRDGVTADRRAEDEDLRLDLLLYPGIVPDERLKHRIAPHHPDQAPVVVGTGSRFRRDSAAM